MWWDGQCHQPLVDPNHLVQQRNQKPQSGTVERADMPHPEHHAAFVFAQHHQRPETQDDEHHDPGADQRDHQAGHAALSSLLFQPPQRVEYRSIAAATWSSIAVRCGRCCGALEGVFHR